MRTAVLSVAALTMFCWSDPAIAAVTPILSSPDLGNEPNLIGINPFPGNLNPSVLETLYGEENLRRVDDAIDLVFCHTGTQATVKAVARFNNPSIEEILGFSRDNSSEWRAALRFQRNGGFPVGYMLPTIGTGLILLADSGPEFELRIQSRAYSNPMRNRDGQDMMVTFEIIGNAGHPNNTIGNYVVGFEVFPNDDRDFQDVVYELSGVTAVPEPATVILLATLGVFSRRARFSERRKRIQGFQPR